jgi:hypothetical protein
VGLLNVYFKQDAESRSSQWVEVLANYGVTLRLPDLENFSILTTKGAVGYEYLGLKGTFSCSSGRLSVTDRIGMRLPDWAEIMVGFDPDEDERAALIAAAVLASLTGGRLDDHRGRLEVRGAVAVAYAEKKVARLSKALELKLAKELAKRQSPSKPSHEKYAPLIEHQTGSGNHGLTTEELIRQIGQLDKKFGVTISEVSSRKLVLHFERLPEDPAQLARKLYKLCPDAVDQHFGPIAEMVERALIAGEEIDPNLLKLIEGIDLKRSNAGVLLLGRSIQKHKQVTLWWD